MIRIRVGSSLALVLCLSSAGPCLARDIAPRAARRARTHAAMRDLRDAPASPPRDVARAERAAWSQAPLRDRGERPAPVPRLRARPLERQSVPLMSVTPRRADPPPWSNPGAVSL